MAGKTKGKVGWSHETDAACYDCVIHYAAYPEERQTWNSPGAPSECEVLGVEVLEVHEYDADGSVRNRRPPTDKEKTLVACEILRRIDDEEQFYRDVTELCFDDADECDAFERSEAADRKRDERRERDDYE